MLESTDAIVLCLSEYVKRSVKQNYELPEDRLPVVFNGVDLARFTPASAHTKSSCRNALGVPHDAPAALFMGQDYQRKGLRHAIAALALATERTIAGRSAPRLLVVGRGRQGPYEQLANERGVGKQVLFLGQRTDPQSTYHAADFLVLPTRHDPCSLAVLEALACGVPVISTVFNGACEVMANDVHGFVLNDPGDERALADAMTRLLDPVTQQRMSRAAVELRQRLSFDEHLRTLLAVYDRIVTARAGR